MEELIELILGNPLLLLLIAGGLISLFRKEGDKNKQENEQRQQTSEQTQPKKPSPFGDFLDRMEDVLTDETEEKRTEKKPKSQPRSRPSYSNEPAQQTMSAHDKRMEQMQQISDQIEAGTYEGAGNDVPSGAFDQSHSGISDYSSPRIRLDATKNHKTEKLRKQMKKRLHGKSLIDSIIMAEVLGEPRSKQPYQRRNMNNHKLY